MLGARGLNSAVIYISFVLPNSNDISTASHPVAKPTKVAARRAGSTYAYDLQLGRRRTRTHVLYFDFWEWHGISLGSLGMNIHRDMLL